MSERDRYEEWNLRTSEVNRTKLIYVVAVSLLVGTAVYVAFSSITNDVVLQFFLVIILSIFFFGVFIIATNTPEKYKDRVCTEIKFFYRDIGMHRWKRQYVFMFDIVIVSFPLMIFAWNFVHDAYLMSVHASPDTVVPFMYAWNAPPEWEWVFWKQGLLDFGFACLGGFLVIGEYVVWLHRRKGDVCSWNFDDLGIMVVSEYDQRVEATEGNYWEDFFSKK